MTVNAYGYAVEPSPIVRRTQKARSVEALRNAGFTVPPFSIHPIEQFIRTNTLFPIPTNDIEMLVGKFVRPCPVVPRHGFVDSRPINTVEEAEKLVIETANVEDKAELISMPFIKSEFSAIYTTGQVVIGPGNAGATEGKESRSIPAIGFPGIHKDRWQKALTLAGITEAPYCEMLWEKKEFYDKRAAADSYGDGEFNIKYVQLRNGPELPQSVDYVPEETTVTKVVLADGDLLEWETKVKSFERGTVVYHPGGSLASHYAVHAVLNRIPVLISKEPKIGDVLKAEAVNASTPDINKIRAGFVYACESDLSVTSAALAMLTGCHSTAVWLGKSDVLLGFAMGCAYRLSVVASLGEFRHKPYKVDGKYSSKVKSRQNVYEKAWDKVLTSPTRTRFVKALNSFKNDKWGSSFGGAKWYAFSALAGDLYNKMVDADSKGALETLNQLIHAQHNGGWAFNKFIHQSVFDQAAINPCGTLIKVAPILYNVIVECERNPEREMYFAGKHHFDVDLDWAAANIEERNESHSEREEEPEEYYCDKCDTYDCCKDCHTCIVEKVKQNKTAEVTVSELQLQPTFSKNLHGKTTVYVTGKKSDGNGISGWLELPQTHVDAIEKVFETGITHEMSPLVGPFVKGSLDNFIKLSPSIVPNKFWIWTPDGLAIQIDVTKVKQYGYVKTF